MKNKTVKKILLLISIPCIVYSTIYFSLSIFKPNRYEYNNEDISTKEGKVIYVNDSSTSIPYLAKVDDNDNILDVDFKILCTSDLHLRDDNALFTLTVLERFIDKQNPDLVIINGDIIHDRLDTIMQEKLISLFESKQTYFAITLGNHDGAYYEGSYIEARENFYNTFSSPYLITYHDSSSIDGYGNCVINIKTSSTKISQTLFFMDTMQEDYTSNQISWYENKINTIKEMNNNVVTNSIVFSHIQLYEYKTCYELCKNKSSECKLLYGNRKEPIDGPDSSNGFFDKMVELNSTKMFVSGHDHNNDLSFMYKGINLLYNQPLSYQTYTRRGFLYNLGYIINRKFDYFNDGVNILMIRNSGSVDNIPLYAQHENVFDGLNKYYKKFKIVYFEKE